MICLCCLAELACEGSLRVNDYVFLGESLLMCTAGFFFFLVSECCCQSLEETSFDGAGEGKAWQPAETESHLICTARSLICNSVSVHFALQGKKKICAAFIVLT